MKIFKRCIGVLFLFLLPGMVLASSGNPLSNSTNNFLGGVIHGQVSHDLTDTTAGSAALEAGSRDLRASGTIGWAVNHRNRLKFTAEYLRQNIDFNFFTGATRQWVQQGAIGLGYQFALNDLRKDYFNVSTYYSYAPSQGLNTITQTATNSSGNPIAQVDTRRIAGSNAAGISPGVTLHFWSGSALSLAANYDDVIYNNTLSARAKSQGFGGTAQISQEFLAYGENFKVSGSAADRAPYNDYQVEMDWIRPYPTSHLVVGVFGDHTQGKNTLPDATIVGLNLTYNMDAPLSAYKSTSTEPQSFTSWVSEPAVRMPTVLAVSDEKVVSGCLAPSAVGTIPNQTNTQGATVSSFATASFFNANGQTLTYSASNLPGNLSIDPASGIISGTVSFSSSGAYPVVVTATGTCGSATQSFTWTVGS